MKLPQCGPKTCFLLTHMKEEGREGFDLTLTDGEKFWEGQGQYRDRACCLPKQLNVAYIVKALHHTTSFE